MPAATIRITNATANRLSLVGDSGVPRITVPATAGSNYVDVAVTSVVGNTLLCDTLSTWITSGYVTVTRGSVTLTAAQMTSLKSAMTSDVYDANLDGLSDKAEQLDFTNATDIDDSDSPYTILDADDVINVDVSSGAVNCLLPAVAAGNKGRIIIIHDVKGNAGTNNITITPDGTDKIDGVAAAITLSADYGIATLRSSGGSDGWYSDRAEISTALAHATSNGNSHSSVVSNNTHRTSDGSDHTFIDQDVTNGAAPVLAVTNMTGSAAGIDSDATAHAASDGSSHTFIDQDVTNGAAPVLAVTNMTGSAAGIDSDATAHAASDGSSHTFIDQDVTNGAAPVLAVTNMTGSAAGIDSDATAHAASAGISHSYIQDNIADVTIAVADASGGATGAALTADLYDLAGSALAKTGVFMIIASDSQYAGDQDQNTNVTFGTATKGSILASGNGWAIVKADSNGEFACTATNSADETVWFACKDAGGGHDAVANGVCVRGCIPDSATWSA